jgi:hypothetical protein
VAWTSPVNDAAVEAMPEARFAGPSGPVYAPILLVQFSEAMDAATLNASTLQVKDANNRLLASSVTYDAGLYQAAILLLEPLQANLAYSAVVNTTVTDAAGNPLAAAYTWGFSTQTGPSATLFLPVVER